MPLPLVTARFRLTAHAHSDEIWFLEKDFSFSEKLKSFNFWNCLRRKNFSDYCQPIKLCFKAYKPIKYRAVLPLFSKTEVLISPLIKTNMATSSILILFNSLFYIGLIA